MDNNLMSEEGKILILSPIRKINDLDAFLNENEDNLKFEQSKIEGNVEPEEEGRNFIEVNLKLEEEGKHYIDVDLKLEEENKRIEEEILRPDEGNKNIEEEDLGPEEENKHIEEENIRPEEEINDLREDNLQPLEESNHLREDVLQPLEESDHLREDIIQPEEESNHLREENLEPEEESKQLMVNDYFDDEINKEHSRDSKEESNSKLLAKSEYEKSSLEHDEIKISEKKELDTIETMPRFAIGHKLKNKTLENSVEDYICFEVVDDKGCEEFRSLTYSYISKKFSDRGSRLYNFFLYEIKTSILHHLDKIVYDNFTLINQLISDMVTVPSHSKISCMACFIKKKKPKLDINLNYQLRKEAVDLRKLSINFKKNWSALVSTEEKVENLYSIKKLRSNIDQFTDKKLNYFFRKNKINEKLKDEVDKYWEYFNIRKILTKQENKLKIQKKKFLALEDAHLMNDCIICMENERNVLFLPCLHLITCETCGLGKLGNDCPECHTKIEHKQITLC